MNMNEYLEYLCSNVTPPVVEHVFLDTKFWDNSDLSVYVSYRYDEFDNEYYLYLTLYNSQNNKCLSESSCPAGLDDKTKMIMTSLGPGEFDVGLKYGATRVWLKPDEEGNVFLHARRGKEKKKILLVGLGSYTDDLKIKTRS